MQQNERVEMQAKWVIERRDRERRSTFQRQDGDEPVGAAGRSRVCLSEFLLAS